MTTMVSKFVKDLTNNLSPRCWVDYNERQRAIGLARVIESCNGCDGATPFNFRIAFGSLGEGARYKFVYGTCVYTKTSGHIDASQHGKSYNAKGDSIITRGRTTVILLPHDAVDENIDHDSLLYAQPHEECTKTKEKEMLLTPEQIEQISKVFGIEPKNETLMIRDGLAIVGQMVWCLHDDGPQEMKLDGVRLANARAFPHYYSLAKPKGRFTYED